MLCYIEYQCEAVWTATRFWTFSWQVFLMSQWAGTESESARTLDLWGLQETPTTHFRAWCVSLPHLSSVWVTVQTTCDAHQTRGAQVRVYKFCCLLLGPACVFTKKTANTETYCVSKDSSFIDSVSPRPLSMGSSSVLWTDAEAEVGLQFPVNGPVSGYPPVCTSGYCDTLFLPLTRTPRGIEPQRLCFPLSQNVICRLHTVPIPDNVPPSHTSGRPVCSTDQRWFLRVAFETCSLKDTRVRVGGASRPRGLSSKYGAWAGIQFWHQIPSDMGQVINFLSLLM